MNPVRKQPDKPFCEYMNIERPTKHSNPKVSCNHPSKCSKDCDIRCQQAMFELRSVKVTLKRTFERNEKLKTKIKELRKIEKE